MAKPVNYPGWTVSGGSAIEPDGAKKLLGWIKGEQPPFQFMNWLQQTFSAWMAFLGGTTRWDFVITSDADEQDYADLAAYLADSPSSGDKVLIKEDQTFSVGTIIPAGIHLHFEKGTKLIFDTAIAGTALELGDGVTIEGLLDIEFTHGAGTIVTGVSYNGDDIKVDLARLTLTGAGGITDAVKIEASKINNYGEFIATTSGGPIATNLNDVSAIFRNIIIVIGSSSIDRSAGAAKFVEMIVGPGTAGTAALSVGSSSLHAVEGLGGSAGDAAIKGVANNDAHAVHGEVIGGTGNAGFFEGPMRTDIGSDATGDMWYRAGTDRWARIPKGSDGDFLKLVAGVPTWVTP